MLGHARILWSLYYGPIGDSKDWDEVLSYNACIMIGLSKIPDEFFEEYEKLEDDEQEH